MALGFRSHLKNFFHMSEGMRLKDEAFQLTSHYSPSLLYFNSQYALPAEEVLQTPSLSEENLRVWLGILPPHPSFDTVV